MRENTDATMAENATLKERISQLEGQLEEKDREVVALKVTVRQMESSISWRFSQFYGKFFRQKSFVTRLLSKALVRVMHEEKAAAGEKAVAKEKAAAAPPQAVSKPEATAPKPLHEREYYRSRLQDILKEREGKIKGIIVYPPTVDWRIPLFQRPHQLALELSRRGYLFFFSTGSNDHDKVDGFYRINENCYVHNQYDLITEELPRFIYLLSSTCLNIRLEDVLRIKPRIFTIYDYIDEIHEDVSGQFFLKELARKHEYMKANADVFIATAENLFDEVKAERSDVRLIPNGADYGHFHVKRDPGDVPEDLREIIEGKRPVIGYYGAIARWFDYELVKEIAVKRPGYEIVLIGFDYDRSIHGQKLEDFKNIHYLGVKDYSILPRYAAWFDVAMIPFVTNRVTDSTSPIKAFEYMASGNPIVTTDMRECRKYKSILIGRDHEDFINRLDEALKLRGDGRYLELLDREARDNTWRKRAYDVLELLSERITDSTGGP